MIQDYIENSNYLDLFAGGGKSSTFIDKNKIAIKTINDNLTKLGIENYRVYLKDFRVFLRETTDKYNLIFIDLSYKTDFIKDVLFLIEKYNLLADDGLIILESDDKSKLIYNDYYTTFKERKYGDKFILILSKS